MRLLYQGLARAGIPVRQNCLEQFWALRPDAVGKARATGMWRVIPASGTKHKKTRLERVFLCVFAVTEEL